MELLFTLISETQSLLLFSTTYQSSFSTSYQPRPTSNEVQNVSNAAFTILYTIMGGCLGTGKAVPLQHWTVFAVVIMKSSIFWDVTLRSLVEVYWNIGGMYYLHLHRQRASKQHASSAWSLLQNVGIYVADYMASHPRTPYIELVHKFVRFFNAYK
jgi:hypothetical protein